MHLPLLKGEVVDTEAELQPLRDRIEELESDLRKMRQERDKARSDGLAAQSAIESLRNVLGPLRRAIGAIWGEIEAAGIPSEPVTAGSPSLGREPHVDSRLHSLDKWEGVKKRLGGKEAELIDVLMTSGPRTNTQLKSLLKAAYPTVAALTLKMKNMGFLERAGECYKLKD